MLSFAAVVFLGILVGVAELVSRYRDVSQRVLYTPPVLAYVMFNGATSALALVLIRLYGLTFGAPAGASGWVQVLVAPLAAMALLRTSLYTVRAGDKDVSVGPAAFLQIFRDAADRAADRLRAGARIELVGNLMEGLDYERVSGGLTSYCVELTPNLPEDQLRNLRNALQLLDSETFDDALKTRILGLHLMNLVGPDVLTMAVEALRKELQPKPDSLRDYFRAEEKAKAFRSTKRPPVDSYSLLTLLNGAPQKQMTIAGLQEASRMGFLDFSQAIQELASTGHLAVLGEATRETAQLTRLGADVASLLRSA